jgi:hypothetical protein
VGGGFASAIKSFGGMWSSLFSAIIRSLKFTKYLQNFLQVKHNVLLINVINGVIGEIMKINQRFKFDWNF